MLIDYKELFYDNNKLNKNKLKKEWIKKNYNDLYLDILNFEKKISINIEKYTQLIWHYNNGIIDYLVCDYCGNKNKRFYGLEAGYKLGCSRHCAILLTRDKSNNTRKINTINKFGVEHTTQLKSTQDKMIKTNKIKSLNQ